MVFVSSAFAITLPLLIPVFQPTNDTNNHVHGTLSNLTEISPDCNKVYGSDLKEESCRNAWDKIDRFSTTVKKFVPHYQVTAGDVQVPIRYLSDDGICAIDILFKKASGGDFSTDRAISQHARMVIDQCVLLLRKGGTITSFSEPFLNCLDFRDHVSARVLFNRSMSSRENERSGFALDSAVS